MLPTSNSSRKRSPSPPDVRKKARTTGSGSFQRSKVLHARVMDTTRPTVAVLMLGAPHADGLALLGNWCFDTQTKGFNFISIEVGDASERDEDLAHLLAAELPPGACAYVVQGSSDDIAGTARHAHSALELTDRVIDMHDDALDPASLDVWMESWFDGLEALCSPAPVDPLVGTEPPVGDSLPDAHAEPDTEVPIREAVRETAMVQHQRADIAEERAMLTELAQLDAQLHRQVHTGMAQKMLALELPLAEYRSVQHALTALQLTPHWQAQINDAVVGSVKSLALQVLRVPFLPAETHQRMTALLAHAQQGAAALAAVAAWLQQVPPGGDLADAVDFLFEKLRQAEGQRADAAV